MNLIPLRTAAIAGTCAVALSFVALPAWADDDTSSDDGTTQSALPDTTTDSTDSTTTDDGTTPTDDAGTQTDDSTSDDSTTGTDDSTTDDSGADDSDDTTPAPVAETPPPAEKGKPRAAYSDTVLTPKEIAKHGVKVVYTGLTPGATYQPYYFVPERFGDTYGTVRTASKKGTLTVTFVWKKEQPSFNALGAVYTVGLLGQDTDLRLTQEISVKYDSDLTWNAAERHGKKVTLSVSVDKDDKAGKSAGWKKIAVAFQKKVGTKWVTVKTVTTNSKGAAKATIKAGVSTWRAVLAGSTTVIGATSGGHRK